MKENYPKAEKFTLNIEGKDSVAKDLGDGAGLTKYGIAQKWHPNINVFSMTLEDALDIYYREYWVPAGCDDMPYPSDCIVFDTAINMGVSRTKQFYAISGDDMKAFLDLRRQKYLGIVTEDPSKAKFLKGWLNRVNTLEDYYLHNG